MSFFFSEAVAPFLDGRITEENADAYLSFILRRGQPERTESKESTAGDVEESDGDSVQVVSVTEEALRSRYQREKEEDELDVPTSSFKENGAVRSNSSDVHLESDGRVPNQSDTEEVKKPIKVVLVEDGAIVEDEEVECDRLSLRAVSWEESQQEAAAKSSGLERSESQLQQVTSTSNRVANSTELPVVGRKMLLGDESTHGDRMETEKVEEELSTETTAASLSCSFASLYSDELVSSPPLVEQRKEVEEDKSLSSLSLSSSVAVDFASVIAEEDEGKATKEERKEAKQKETNTASISPFEQKQTAVERVTVSSKSTALEIRRKTAATDQTIFEEVPSKQKKAGNRTAARREEEEKEEAVSSGIAAVEDQEKRVPKKDFKSKKKPLPTLLQGTANRRRLRRSLSLSKAPAEAARQKAREKVREPTKRGSEEPFRPPATTVAVSAKEERANRTVEKDSSEKRKPVNCVLQQQNVRQQQKTDTVADGKCIAGSRQIASKRDKNDEEGAAAKKVAAVGSSQKGEGLESGREGLWIAAFAEDLSFFLENGTMEPEKWNGRKL